MNVKKTILEDEVSDPLIRVKTQIVDTISDIKDNNDVNAEKLKPLLNLLREVEKRINLHRREGIQNNDWNSYSLLKEKLGNTEVDVTNKIAYLLNYIHIESAILAGINKAKQLNCDKNKDQVNLEYIRSREKRNLLSVSLRLLVRERSEQIQKMGFNKDGLLSLAISGNETNEETVRSALIRANCAVCQQERDLGQKSDKVCYCYFYGNKKSHTRVSGILHIKINKIIQLLAAEEIDQLMNDDNLSIGNVKNNTQIEVRLRKKKIVIWVDNTRRISTDWCIESELRLNKRLEVFKGRELYIEVWECIAQDIRMVATTVVPLESIARSLSCYGPDCNTAEIGSIAKDTSIFLEPCGLMNAELRFTGESSQSISMLGKSINGAVSVRNIPNGDRSTLNNGHIHKSSVPQDSLIAAMYQNRNCNTGCKLKRRKIFWAKMKRCRLVRPDEADITVSLWVHWFKHSIDKLIVPKPEEPADNCIYESDYSKINGVSDIESSAISDATMDDSGDSLKYRFYECIRKICVKALRLHRQKLDITPHSLDSVEYDEPSSKQQRRGRSYNAILDNTSSFCGRRSQSARPSGVSKCGSFMVEAGQPLFHQTPSRTVCQFITSSGMPTSSGDNDAMNYNRGQVNKAQIDNLLSTMPHPSLTSTPYHHKAPLFAKQRSPSFRCQSTDYSNFEGEMDEGQIDRAHLTVHDLDREESDLQLPPEQSIYFIQEVYQQHKPSVLLPSRTMETIAKAVSDQVSSELYYLNRTSSSNAKSNSYFRSSPSPLGSFNANISKFICPEDTRDVSSGDIVMEEVNKVTNRISDNYGSEDERNSYVTEEKLEDNSHEMQPIGIQSSDKSHVEELMSRDSHVLSRHISIVSYDDGNGHSRSTTSTQVGEFVTEEQDKIDFDEDLEMISVLGMGHFGKVLLVRLRESKLNSSADSVFAVKIMNKRRITCEMEYEALMSERNILATLGRSRNPFLVDFLGCFQTQTHLMFALEFASGGDLMGHVHNSPFSENAARFYGACVILAFEYLHNLNIMYRDLKLDNVLMDRRGYVKLTDFGLSKENMSWNDYTSTFCGTPEFLAPEIINESHYCRVVDWWAFGVLMFEMIRGESPFPGEGDDEVMESIRTGVVDESNFSPEALGLIRRLLQMDPKRRLGYGPNGSEQVMRQPFFRRIDWEGMRMGTVDAPLVPKLTSPSDVHYFEEDFTSLSVNIRHEEDPCEDDENGIEEEKVQRQQATGIDKIDQYQFEGFDISIDWSKLEL